MKTYEIWNLTTGELLVDNLEFDDMPELYGAYLEFYPNDNIVVLCREINLTVIRERIASREPSRRKKFMNEWFNFIEELMTLDNVY